MKPYGYRSGDDVTEAAIGASSKHRKMTGKHRQKCRRLLHKQGRNDSKKLLRDEKNGENSDSIGC